MKAETDEDSQVEGTEGVLWRRRADSNRCVKVLQQELSHAVVRLCRRSVRLLTFQWSTRRWAELHEQRFGWLGDLSNLALHQLSSEEIREGWAGAFFGGSQSDIGNLISLSVFCP